GELVERHFGDVPARPKPERPSFAEPAPTRELRGNIDDSHAPLPAVAVGYRLPDPDTDLRGYLAHAVLAGVLTEGDSARLQQRMVYAESLVTDIHSGCGLVGSPLDGRDPDTFTVTAMHPPQVSTDRLLGVLDEELEKLASTGPEPRELARVSMRWVAALHTEHDRVLSRVLDYGSSELLRGRAELVTELPQLIIEVSVDDVSAAAKAMRPDTRAVLTVTPIGSSDTGTVEGGEQ
ncbi:MAG: M16 family metallopeptidase, partial [Sciscionella sp.]